MIHNALKGWLGVALMIGWPLIPYWLVNHYRNSGWEQHRECIAEAVRRQQLTTAEEVLQTCQELP